MVPEPQAIFGSLALRAGGWLPQGLSLKAVTSWCQNCPAERQGRHQNNAFPDFCVSRFIFGSGFWDRIWSILCVVDPIYVWWIPSEVACEIAGRWRIENHPRAGLHQHDGFTTPPRSPPTFFMECPWRILHEPPWSPGRRSPAAARKRLRNQQKLKVPNPTVLPLETLSLLLWLSWPQPTASELWNVMKCYEVLLNIIKHYEISKYYGMLWNITKYYGILWNDIKY